MAALSPLTMLVAALAATPAAAQTRGFDMRASPPPTLPTAPQPAPPRRYDPAPLPNRDLDAPYDPRGQAAPELGPGVFTRREQYRGDGFSPGSTAQSDQDRRAKPGAGFKLRMPFQPN